VPFSILVNGTSSGFFSSSHGLRHGDHLSPLLFVIVIEALSKMISTLVDGGLFSSFMVGSRSAIAINISQLLFADDTLIFSEANLDHLRNCAVCFYALK
jgi:hypothetical protein